MWVGKTNLEMGCNCSGRHWINTQLKRKICKKDCGLVMRLSLSSTVIMSMVPVGPPPSPLFIDKEERDSNVKTFQAGTI